MNKRVDPIFALSIRLIAVAAVALMFVRVLSAAVSPDGYLRLVTDIVDPSPFISEPKPSERLELTKGAPYRVTGNPVYFDLQPPSDFETVTVQARYLNQGQSVVEIGALVNRLDGQFDLQGVENRLIDSLAWPRLTSGKMTLLQRTSEYRALDDFIAQPPDPSRVAVYRTSLNWPYRPTAASANAVSKTRQVSLRGHHRLLTYSDGAPLAINFSVQDMNRQSGADPVTLSVYRQGVSDAVARTVLADDGNTSDDQLSSGLRQIAVSLTDPEPGLYRLEFTAPADVFIRSLTTRQNKLVFLDRLYLADHVGYSDQTPPVTVYLGGRTVMARTAHEEGLQKLAVDDWALEVSEIHQPHFSWLGQGRGPFALTSPRRDILLETDGVFALHPDDFFSPLPTQLDWYLGTDDLDSAGIDFIVTEYEQPLIDDRTTVAQATFAVDQLATTEDGAYRFAFSAPGIEATQEDLRLESVAFILQREPVGWWGGLAALLNDLGWEVNDRQTGAILPTGQSYGEHVE
jgi:hypothetical protein